MIYVAMAGFVVMLAGAVAALVGYLLQKVSRSPKSVRVAYRCVVYGGWAMGVGLGLFVLGGVLADDGTSVVQRPDQAVTATSRPTTVTTSPVAVAGGRSGAAGKGPDEIAFDQCRENGPAVVADEFGVPRSASHFEIARAYATDLLREPFRAGAIESCLLGFEAGGW